MLKTFSNTRVLIDYDTFAGGLNDGVIVCTNAGVLGAIRVLIRSYGLRITNWATSYSDAGYIVPDAWQFDTIEANISEFLEETNDMAFCSDIVGILQDIANNLGGAGCGCGSAGAGSTEGTPSTEQPGFPGDPQPGDEVPPGFADYAEYNAYKCDMAEWLVQKVESDLGWWQGANFVTITLAAFIAGILTPIPGDEIIALLGLLASLALQGVTIAAVGNMIDAVSNNRLEILCALYRAGNAGQSTSNVQGAISDAIDGETAAIYAPILKSILNQMIGTDNVNRLYVRWDEKADDLPTGDCDDCACSITTNIGTDNGGGNWDTAFWAPAVDPPGKNVVSVEWKNGGGGNCEVDQLLIVPTNINPTPGGGFKGYQLYDAGDVLIYNSDTVPPVTDGVHKFVVQSNTVGEVDVTWVS